MKKFYLREGKKDDYQWVVEKEEYGETRYEEVGPTFSIFGAKKKEKVTVALSVLAQVISGLIESGDVKETDSFKIYL